MSPLWLWLWSRLRSPRRAHVDNNVMRHRRRAAQRVEPSRWRRRCRRMPGASAVERPDARAKVNEEFALWIIACYACLTQMYVLHSR